MRWTRPCLFALFGSLLIDFGCGGGGGSTATPVVVDKAIASIVVYQGDTQSAAVGTELPNPLVAQILNKAGLVIVGQTVNFRVAVGGGAVFAGAATSDASGYVRERWTLGTVAGPQKVEVRAVDSNGAAVVFATFNATAVAGAPQSVTIISGNGQNGQLGQALVIPLKVKVADSYGNPNTGVSVAFTANNGGSAAPNPVITDAAGEATTTWTLGQALGSQTLSAIVTGITPVIFTAQGPLYALSKISGDLQTVEQYFLLPLPVPIQVLLTDAAGHPVVNEPISFSATSISTSTSTGNCTNISRSTDGSGIVSWQPTGCYFDATGQQTIVATWTGSATVTFKVNVIASSHKYDGKYLIHFSDLSTVSMNIFGGLIVYPFSGGGCSDYGYIRFGTLNESNGSLTATQPRGGSVCNTRELVGQLTLDSLNKATGSGTSTEETTATRYLGLPPIASTWTCERQ